MNHHSFVNGIIGLSDNDLDLSFHISDHGAHFRQNQVTFATTGGTLKRQRQADRQGYIGGLIICSLLCYSNRTDKL